MGMIAQDKQQEAKQQHMSLLRAHMACVRYRRDLEVRKRHLMQSATQGKIVDSEAYKHVRQVLEPAITRLGEREAAITRELRELRGSVANSPG